MVRLMYGGRTSIYIGVLAAVITTLFAVIIGTLAGYYRGWIDAVLSRILDVGRSRCCCSASHWAHLALGGFKIGGLVVAGDSLWIPILIIGLVYVPYMARPVRGEILALRRRSSSRPPGPGKGPVRIMVPELLEHRLHHHRCSSLLNIANMLLESALSFLAGRAPAQRVMGHDDRRRVPDHLHRTAPDHRPRPDDRADGVVAQRLRRRPARCAGPAGQDQAGALACCASPPAG
jgi:peptide/nickel transport system permease protein